MNTNNKKGFVFVELLIVTCILMVGLIVIYKQFSSSIIIQKQKLKYDTVASVYKVYYTTREYLDYVDEGCIKIDESNYNCSEFRTYIEDLMQNKNKYYMIIKASTNKIDRNQKNTSDENNGNLGTEIVGTTFNLNTFIAFNVKFFVVTECGTSADTNPSSTLTTIKNLPGNVSGGLIKYFQRLKECDNKQHYRFVGEFTNPITKLSNYANQEYPS